MTMTKKALVLFPLALLFACSQEVENETVIRTVRTMQIGLQSHDTERVFNGQAQTDRVIDLSFRSGGIITTFNIRLGQAVGKGELLAELDNVAARLAYEQARASLNSAKSDLDTQELALQRVQTLYERGGASLSDYENAKNAQRNARANHRSALRSVEIQQEQIRYGKIYAPEDGVISQVNKELEENASAGETVAVLNAGTAMEIQVGIPESVINLVKVDAAVDISFAALPNQQFAGVVTEVAPSIDRQTATYPVRVRVENATEDVKSGMAATVNFKLSRASSMEQEIFVPAHAIGEDANGQFVFTVESVDAETTLVRKRVIELGQLVGEAFEVASGLQEGDIVVTAGVHSVLDGQQVRLQSPR